MTVIRINRTGPVSPSAVYLHGARMGHDYRPTEQEQRAIALAKDMIVNNSVANHHIHGADTIIDVLRRAVASR